MTDNFSSRPRDKSLQAFKDWIGDVYQALNPGATDTLTEEQWVEKWKEFWSIINDAKDDPGASTREK